MATRRRKSRKSRKSCKYGKLKRKSGRRRCRKSRKKRSKKCKYGKLKRKTKRRRCKKKRNSRKRRRRTYKMGPVLDKFKNTHINKTIYTDRVSDEEINDKISKGHWAGGWNREYYMLRNIYRDYNPNYYKEDTDNLSKQFYFDDGKTWYVDVQQVDFAGNVVNPTINTRKLKSFLDLVRPINMDESGIAG